MRYLNWYGIVAMLLCCVSMAGVFKKEFTVVIGAGLSAIAWATLAVAHRRGK